MSIKIFCDIADLTSVKNFNKKKIVRGFTTNPSLMRNAGAKDYKLYSKKILKICKDKPVSLEVFPARRLQIPHQLDPTHQSTKLVLLDESVLVAAAV